MKNRISLFIVSCIFAICAMAQTRTHVVKRGESYASIARIYGISEENLKSYNTKHPTCYVGLKVNVPYNDTPYRERVQPQNEYEAFIKTANAAIERNDIDSAYYLATYYKIGYGTDKDEAMAVWWYKYGYSKGHVPSSLKLADCLEKGIGTKADERFALMIYGKLAQNDNEEARNYLSKHGYEKRSWFYLEQFGEIPESVKKKWEEEDRKKAEEEKRRRAEEERKRKEEEQRKAEEQRKVAASQQTSTSASSGNSSSSSTSQQSKKEDYVLSTAMYTSRFHDNGDGSSSVTTQSVCVYCYGNGRCPGCQFVMMNPRVYGGFCRMCGGTHQCPKCKGSGSIMSYGRVDNQGNGYMIGQDGTFASTGGGYSSDSSSSSSSSSSSRSGSSYSTCTKCGGSGYQSSAYSYAGASTAGWKQPYHFTGGSCPYCSNVSDHYHYPCTECRGYGHVRN